MSNKEKLIALRAQMKAMKEAISETAKVVFTDMVRELFETHPTLEAIRWRQYTPYFNDGEECVFRANTKYPTLWFTDLKSHPETKLEGFYSSEEDDGGFDPSVYRIQEMTQTSNSRVAVANAVFDFLGLFESEDLKEMFGDHAEIRVTRDGVEVNEYQHD